MEIVIEKCPACRGNHTRFEPLPNHKKQCLDCGYVGNEIVFLKYVRKVQE